MARLCNLAINTSGAWKTVIRFDIDAVDEGALRDAAATIALSADSAKKPTLRIATADALAQPLLLWSESDGWQPWRHV